MPDLSGNRWFLFLVFFFSALRSPAQEVTAVSMPQELNRPCKADLVDLASLNSNFHFDIRYAGSHNFLGKAVYPSATALLQRPAAQALLRVESALGKKGYGILILDAYRPWSVTRLFWENTPPEKRAFVADPAKGSKHNRGCAVDLTLYDRRTGLEVLMPSEFDDMSIRAHPRYKGGSLSSRRHRDLLRRAMEKEGFSVEPNEWWHFNYRTWSCYPILDTPFQGSNR